MTNRWVAERLRNQGVKKAEKREGTKERDFSQEWRLYGASRECYGWQPLLSMFFVGCMERFRLRQVILFYGSLKAKDNLFCSQSSNFLKYC